MNNNQGWINLYKPKNLSSFQAKKKLKKFFNRKNWSCRHFRSFSRRDFTCGIRKDNQTNTFCGNEPKNKFTITWGSKLQLMI